MVFLDSVLAFAITLLAFSLVVTLLVDFTVAKLGFRHQTVVSTLKVLYSDYIQFNRASDDTPKVAAEADTFVRTLLNFVGLRQSGGGTDLRCQTLQEDAKLYQKSSPVVEIAETTLANALSADLFADKKLTAIEVGAKLQGDNGTDENDFYRYVKAHYFLRMENQQRLFKVKAKRISYSFSFLVVVLFNVNALDLYQAFMGSAAARENVIQSYSTELKPQAEKVLSGAASVQDIRPIMQTVDSWQLPIGWKNSAVVTEIYNFKQGSLTVMQLLFALVTWLIGLIAAGLMIGQGAPFWFDLIQKMVKIRDSVKSAKG
ncbi:MAG: hypothetical protein Q9N68_08780 [Gammaproteobacteria bacterium]|nr:hypothetical protein [Gammaproteobacteria bacterium]